MSISYTLVHLGGYYPRQFPFFDFSLISSTIGSFHIPNSVSKGTYSDLKRLLNLQTVIKE